MDYYLKSDALEQIRQPIYFIQLKTQQPDGSIKDVEFSADFNELQDFLFKLNDAKNQIIKKVKAQEWSRPRPSAQCFFFNT